ncbi:hypothetical protein [uncultured Polaribacter sp.]|uniref:hypothetical protein n=1 Tax=uncultured Polaribacter sp. TaxID=174711 RepID=UPI00262B49BC|nr:hypothetical protein [uncultured Polaribacter sp.]
MKLIIKYIALISLLIIFSCSYNFTEDNFIEIVVPSKEDNSFVFQNFKNKDTINTRKELNYSFTSKENQHSIDSKVYLDNEEIVTSWNSNLGSITLTPSRYNDGVHTLRIEHSFTTGSGSINDQINEEIITKKETFTFIVKRNPSIPPAVTSAVIENGSITVNWDKPSNLDYKNAYLCLKSKYSEKRVPLTADDLASQKHIDTSTILITGPSNTWYYDAYSTIEYYIIFESEYTEVLGGSQKKSYDPSWVDFKLSYIDKTKYKVIWNQYPLYNNFKEFNIGTDVEAFKGSSTGGEHIINEPYVIGKKYGASLSISTKNGTTPYISIPEIELDKNTFGVFDYNHLYSQKMIYNEFNDNYYSLIIVNDANHNNAKFIYQFSNTLEFIRRKEITSVIDININPVNYNLIYDNGSDTYELDKNNLEIVKSYLNDSDTGWNHRQRADIRFSWNIYEKRVKIVNTKNGTTLYNEIIKFKQYLFSSYLGVISNDGKYVHIPDWSSSIGTIYKIENDKLVKFMEVSNSTVQFYEEKAIYRYGNEITVIDLNTKATEYFNTGGGFPEISYDSQSKKVLLQTNGQNRIYDLSTKTTEIFSSEDRKFGRPYYVYSDLDYKLYLFNDRLIHTKGIYIDNY